MTKHREFPDRKRKKNAHRDFDGRGKIVMLAVLSRMLMAVKLAPASPTRSNACSVAQR